MTATLTRPPGNRPAPNPVPRTGWYPLGDDSRRTAMVGIGSVLAFAPLFVIFTDWTWFIEATGAAICVLGPAIALRYRSIPRSWHLLPGLVLLIVYATALYLSRSAVVGLIPGPDAWDQYFALRTQAAEQIQDNVTPLVSTHALRLFIVPGLGVFAALVDWYAVVRRAPALAGVPLLALFTVCGAIAGTTVGWIPFTSAAVGFLIILSADSRISLLSWGRVVPRRHGDRTARARVGLSGRRIGIVAVIAAVAIPMIIPGLSRNLLADAFHGNGTGTGGGEGTSLSPFATLKGELTLGKPIDLAEVTVDPGVTPFFLRSKVLDNFTGSGWVASRTPRGQSVTDAALEPALPVGGRTSNYQAKIQIKALTDVAPLLGSAQSFDGLRSSWRFSSTLNTLVNSKTTKNETYTEQVVAPSPTADELARSGPVTTVSSTLTELPASFPPSVRALVTRLTRNAGTPYERAIAMFNYFRDPANGFVYNLSTKAGDSGSDLVDFLENKSGFCQQYAAALAVMFRVAQIPARVVLGYTHAAPDKTGKFTVTSHDAHAWVEGYFEGIGWLPFNPTPLIGADQARNVEVPYAPAPGATTANPSTGATTSGATSAPAGQSTDEVGRGNQEQDAGGSGTTSNPLLPAWVLPTGLGLLGVVVLLSVLPGLRSLGRRGRFRDALRTGRLEPLWQELQASAIDTGTAWGPSTTPRQVPGWLAERGVAANAAVASLAEGVERERYAPAAGPDPDLGTDLARGSGAISDGIGRVESVQRAMRATMNRRSRVQAVLWPASIIRGWRRPRSGIND